jgi:predicted histone-like DNA-binding protein
MKDNLVQKIDGIKGGASAKWYAAAVQGDNVSTDRVAQMVSDSSTATPADVRAVLGGAAHYLAGLLAEGDSVSLEGIGTFRLTIASEGVEDAERFRPSNIVGFRVVFTPDAELVKEVDKKIKYRDSGVRGGRESRIYSVFDVSSELVNKVLTPGGAVRAEGQMMKIYGTDPAVGLWLVSLERNEEFVLPMQNIPVNGTKEIVFIVPGDLPKGFYKIRLVTQYCKSAKRVAKGLRVFVFEKELEVV